MSYANSVDPYQMQCFAASELCLHCLPMSIIIYGILGVNGFKPIVKVARAGLFKTRDIVS